MHEKPVALFANGKTDDNIHIGQYMNYSNVHLLHLFTSLKVGACGYLFQKIKILILQLIPKNRRDGICLKTCCFTKIRSN